MTPITQKRIQTEIDKLEAINARLAGLPLDDEIKSALVAGIRVLESLLPDAPIAGVGDRAWAIEYNYDVGTPYEVEIVDMTWDREGLDYTAKQISDGHLWSFKASDLYASEAAAKAALGAGGKGEQL